MGFIVRPEICHNIYSILSVKVTLLRESPVLIKEKRGIKFFVAGILTTILMLPLVASNSTTTAHTEPESIVVSEPVLDSGFSAVISHHSLSFQSQRAVNEDIEDDINPEEEILETEIEPEPVLTHETSTVVPDGFEIYAVTYHIFNTGVSGPNIAIIGGVHGNERSGQVAAQYLVENFDFTSGSFLIIPKATAPAPEKWGPGGHNLNRQFPGKSDGTAAQRVAAVITELLDDFLPCVVIDMHEANRDGFSNKILFWPNHEITSEKLEAIRYVSDAINQTDLVGRHLGSFGGRDFGPARSKLVPGTTTQAYTLRYNIPAFTTETCMSNRLSVRVDQKLFIINALYEFYQNIHDKRIRISELQEKMDGISEY